MGFPTLDDSGDDAYMAEERRLVTKAKKAVLLALGTAAQQLGQGMREAQEVLGYLSDMMMAVYGMESCVLRTVKLDQRGDGERAALASKLTRLFCHDAMQQIEISGRNVLSAVAEGDMLTATLSGLRRTVKHNPVNAVQLRREVAETVTAGEAWPLY